MLVLLYFTMNDGISAIIENKKKHSLYCKRVKYIIMYYSMCVDQGCQMKKPDNSIPPVKK